MNSCVLPRGARTPISYEGEGGTKLVHIEPSITLCAKSAACGKVGSNCFSQATPGFLFIDQPRLRIQLE